MDTAEDMPHSRRFSVVTRLGEGGMGTVYEAVDQERKARVALKALRRLGPEEVLRFKGEFRKLQDLHHPNLVSLGELVEEEGQWFFTMELVHGTDFLSYVSTQAGSEEPTPHADSGTSPRSWEEPTWQGTPAAASPEEETVRMPPSELQPAVARAPQALQPPPAPRPRRFDEGRLRSALAQLARGLHALHRAGKVHRDIKPSNLLVTAEGRVVLLDFGILSDLEEDEGGKVVGTAAYMAPEQVRGAAPSPAADWYSVGVLLYQALTGQRPFTGGASEVMEAKCRLEPLPPQALVAELPEDLGRLCMELLRREPRQRPAGEQVLRRLGVAAQAQEEAWGALALPFVGRRAELKALHQALEDSRGGASVVVRVEGESGVGKSRLVRRFVNEVLWYQPEAVVLSGRCYERESVPYKGVDGLMDSLARHLVGPGREHAAQVLGPHVLPLVRLFPVLGQVEALAGGSGQLELADPLQLRLAAFAALRQVLGRLAERQPLVLVVDDLQWADRDSAALLDEVLQAPGLLLVGTVRAGSSVSTQGRTADVSSSRCWQQARVVSLEGLRPEEAQALVERLLHKVDGAEDMEVQRIVQESGGHPLFVDALVRYRRQEGRLGQPLRLEEALWARARLLEPGARGLLELLAIAGGPLTHAVAAQASALEPTEYTKATASLRGARLAITTGPAAADAVEVLHDKVRQAVVPHLGARERQAWHARLASALEVLGQGDAEVRAHHWHESGQVERAVGYYTRAAREASAALAFSRAARLYGLALQLGSLSPEEGRRLRLERAEALVNAGRGQEAAQVFLEAAEGASASESLSLRRRAGEQLLVSGHVEQALALLRQVLAEVGASYPETVGQALTMALWHRAWLGLRSHQPRPRPSSQVPAAVRERLEIFGSLAQGLAGVDPLRSHAFHSRHLRLALQAGEPRHLCRALAVESNIHALYGRRLAAERSALRAQELAARLAGDEATRGFVLAVQAWLYNILGELHAARAAFEQALALLERCQHAWWERAVAWEAGVYCLLYQGDAAWLRQRLDLALAEARERGDRRTLQLLVLSGGFLVHLAEGDLQGVRRLLEEAMEGCESPVYQVQDFNYLMRRVSLHLYQGQPAEALQLLAREWPRAERARLLSFPLMRGRLLELRARARVMRAAEAGPQARELLRAAEADTRQLGRIELEHMRGLAESLRAALAEVRGLPEAAELYGRAAATLESTGALLAAWCQRLRQGELLGGEAGQALVARAREWMEQHGLRHPERLADLHTSGPRAGPAAARTLPASAPAPGSPGEAGE